MGLHACSDRLPSNIPNTLAPMNDSSIDMNPSIEEVNALRQRLLELEQANCQCLQQIECLTQQLNEERIARQQVEERLQLTLSSAQAANERFQLAAKAVNCLIYDWCLELDRVERTDGLTRLLGYTLEEAEPTGQWWSDRIHPEDLQPIQEQASLLLMQDDYFSAEYRVLNKANEYIYVLDQCLVAARDADGRPTRIVGSTTDISERKRSEAERSSAEAERNRVEAELRQREQEFRALVENTPDIIVRYDRDLRHLYINPSIERALGVAPKQFIGKTGVELGFNDVRSQTWYATLQQVFATGQSCSLEYEFPNSAGELRFYQAHFIPELIEAGQVKTVVGVARDVTEYKQVEISLRQSEQRLQLAQQAGRIGTWEWNLQTNEVSWSDGIWTLLALEPNSITPDVETFTRFIHPDDRPRVFSRVEAALAQGDEYYDEFRVIRQDGAVCWLISKGRVIRSPDGQPERVLGVNVDITERVRVEEDRKQAEAALAESNQTLQAIIRACPLAIMGLRADGTVRIWNPAAERIFGWSPQEVYGQFLPAIPVDRQDEFLNNLAVTIHGQGLSGVEAQRQKKGNVRVDVELWTAPVDEAQAGISCVSVVADITARKRTEAALRLSEERLHGFVSSNVIGIVFGDFEGGIQEANDEFLRIVGYTREELQAGRLRWIDITPPEYMPLEEERIAEARRRGACTPYEKEYIRKDGSRVPVLVGYGLVLAVREEAVAFILDLSDRKQAEAEREQLLRREQNAREQAEAANRVKDEFLAVLSHELRTPLNPILGWTRLLRTRQFDPTATDRALDTIERNAKLQAQLIEDLLDVSRILQGKVQLNAAPVNLLNIVEAALETVRLSAEAKGIQIHTRLDANIGLVNGDANRLQQVVWNLLSNAVKFTPSGGQIEVCLGQVEMEEGEGFLSTSSSFSTYAQIQVIDTGQGINPEFLPHVFDYFRQADSSTTRQFGGLGLGLAIVRHLVELHGGTVKADSLGHGMGATFTVRLPLLRSEKDRKMRKWGEIDSLPTAPLQPFTQLRILIVDDEVDMRDLLRFILEEQGATVIVAASATEALQHLSESVPDILISDIGMPEMDGYALIKKIRTTLNQSGKMLPAIALTAYAGESNQRQALSAGFQLHLAKPIEPEYLVKAITQVMQSFRPPS
jgi:PAS domain S-box-containing protein